MEEEIKDNNSNPSSYKSLIGLGLGALAVGYYFYSKKNFKDLETVQSVDLDKYAGKWYEIAVIPYMFEKNCSNTVAEYAVTDKGYVTVHNQCTKDFLEDKSESIDGKAYPVKGSNNSKLKVQFFPVLKGDYWIIDLDKDYKYAVVGTPNRKNLWILSRTPKMDEELYQELIEKAKAKDFDISKLKKTAHYRPAPTKSTVGVK
ncbi:MAG: lipocalin family protein [Candidatus Sericytochromatia bacterium]|nr:lipocalin family protein [Candidatus Sericytochromatia bacterium]